MITALNAFIRNLIEEFVSPIHARILVNLHKVNLPMTKNSVQCNDNHSEF